MPPGLYPAAPSRRPADVRFLVPHEVRRVTLVGLDARARAAFEAAGLELVEERADLVVASWREARRAARLGARSIVVHGPARRTVTRSGYRTQTLAVRSGPVGPRLIVPLQPVDAARRALLGPMPGRGRAKGVAIRVGLAAMRAGWPVNGILTLGTSEPGPPAPIGAAAALGVPPRVSWHLWAGEGDGLQRLVWLCAEPGSQTPGWAIKSTRVRGLSAPFDDDEAGLALLAGCDRRVRRHAPTFLGHIDVDGHPGSVETAAAGPPMHDLLRSLGHSDAAVPLVRQVAEWAIDLATATQQPPEALAGELERLTVDVLPAWAADGVTAELVAGLPPIPAVVQHGDLGPWNIVGEAGHFTVVDWESARPSGLPLWDLVYFVTDALASATRTGEAAKLATMVALLRGDLDTSLVLFDLVGAGASAGGVPREAVGAVVTLGWLHHGLSAQERAGRRAALAAAPAPEPPELMHELARRWLQDPSLGAGWPAFLRASM